MGGRRSKQTQPIEVDARGPDSLYRFDRLSPEDFEEACCFLLSKEDGIANADRYKGPRERQFGVDVIGECKEKPYIEVVSCKRYESIRKGQIPAFGDEFLDHYKKVWKIRSVRRFVLAVACDLRHSARQAEIEQEKVRFKELGIAYDYWDLRRLTIKGRSHQGFLRDFFNKYPAESPAPEPRAITSVSIGLGAIDAALAAQFAQLRQAVASQVGARLEGMQEDIKAFGYAKVRGELEALVKDEGIWGALPTEQQARILRMRALDCLSRGAVDEAEQLAGQAEKIYGKPEQKVRALVAYLRHDLQMALAHIAEPETADGAMLRTAMLIEIERLDEAEQLLQKWSDPLSIGAEWHRMRTLLYFMRGDQDKATEELGFVQRLAPDWASTHYLVALFDYHKGLSPAFEFRMTGWPDPVHFGLVRRDDAGQGYFKDALARFDLLLERTEPGFERNRLVAWRLACLCNTSAKTSEALEYCQTLLGSDDFSPAVVFWALAGGIEFDRKAVVSTLESRLEGAQSGIEDLQALIACRMAKNQFGKARSALEKFARQHTDPLSKQVIERWSARIALRTGGRRTKDVRIDDRVDAMLAPKKGGIDQSAAEAIVADPKTPAAERFAACVALAGVGHWPVVRNCAKQLVEEVRTSEAVRLAVYALYNTDETDDLEAFIDDHRHFFPGGNLPVDLRRILTAVVAKSGDIGRAIALARELAGQTDNANDALSLARLHVLAGDVAGAVPLLRNLVDRQPWTAREALPLVKAVSTQDQKLAQDLMRRVLASDTAVSQAGNILPLAHRLGMEAEASALIGQALSRGEEGAREAGVVATSFDQILTFVKAEREALAKAEALYRSGSVPIQIAAPRLRWNIAALWDAAFHGMQVDPPLTIRSGNRPADFFGNGIPDPPELWLDISALLTAFHLGLLDTVLGAFPEIAIPKSLPAGLEHIEGSLHHSQPHRLALLEDMLRDIKAGRITITGSGQPDGATVPVRFPPVGPNPPAQPASTIYLAAVLKELERRGIVSSERATELRGHGDVWLGQAPEAGIDGVKGFEFEVGTLEQMYAAQLVDPVSRVLAISIDADSVSQLETEVRVAHERLRVAQDIAAIRRRVADALLAGKCKFIPDYDLPASATEMGAELADPVRELIGAAGPAGRWIWFDDRMLTGNTQAGDGIVVSTFEILDSLRQRKAVVDEAYFEALQTLRRSNVQIIPIRGEEVVWCLERSSIVDGLVEEGPELIHLRRSLNKRLLMKPNLYLDRHVPGKIPEVACLVEAMSLLRHALDEIWSTVGLSLEARVAWSDWAWRALRVEWLDAVSPNDAAGTLWHETIARLLLTEISLPSGKPEADSDWSIRQQYVSWLQIRIPALAGEASVQENDKAVAAIAGVLSRTLSNELKDENGVDVDKAIHQHIIVGYCNEFPDQLRKRLYNIPPLNSIARTKFQSIIDIGGVKFDAAAFWQALEVAMRGEPSRVRCVGSDDEYSIRSIPPSPDVPTFELSGPTSIPIQDPAFFLLSGSLAQRLKFLEGNREYICPSDVDASQELVRIASLEPPSARIEAFKDGHLKTAAGRYHRLREVLNGDTESIPIGALETTSARVYLGDLAMGTEADVPDWESVATELIERFGAEAALDRLAGIPIVLPSALKIAFGRLPADQRQGIFDVAIESNLTPMRTLRLLELSFVDPLPTIGRLRESLMRKLLAYDAEGLAAFEVMLGWSQRVWMRDPEWWGLPPAQKLACVWAHAERIFGPFCFRARKSWIREYFSGVVPQLFVHALMKAEDFKEDVASPKHVNPELLLAHILATVFPELPELEAATLDTAVDLLVLKGQAVSSPKLQLYADPRDARDALGSFLRAELPGWLTNLLKMGEVAVLSRDVRDRSRSELLAGLANDPQDPNEWLKLSVLVFDFLRPEEKEAIRLAISRWQFPEGKCDVPQANSIMAIARALPSCDALLRTQVEAQFWSWVQRLVKAGDGEPSELMGDSRDSTSAAYSEMVFSLAQRDSSHECLAELAKVVIKLLQLWPAEAPFWKTIIERALIGVSHDDGRSLWPALLLARALT